MYLGTEQADTVPYIVLPRHIPNCSMVNISDEDVQVRKDWSHLSKLVLCRCLWASLNGNGWKNHRDRRIHTISMGKTEIFFIDLIAGVHMVSKVFSVVK